jgi:integrase
LLFASTGIRAGAIRQIRLKHIEKIEKFDLHKIRVYGGTSHEYVVFCTPEATKSIDSYLDYRKRSGEKLNSDSFLIVQQLNTMGLNGPIKSIGYARRSFEGILEDHLKRAGLREIDHVNHHKRKEVARLTEFRKFFNTMMIKSHLDRTIKETLMGHSTELDTNYFRPTDEDLLNEYLKAIDLLTINEENRLKKKVDELTQKQDEIALMKLKHDGEMKEMDQKLNKIMSLVQQNPKLVNVKPESLKKRL